MTRRDIDHDGAGAPLYTPETEDYITEEAARLRLTFDQAAEIYEKARDGGRPLHDMPTPDEEETP